ncbi:MAG: DegT/DnrJ/EryC1/StrS family aminotransferase [Opitutaceae bacterium]|nr:DegT/DnrJ/EryC1/StrS family aminotransferase [Opitutaceae bacterium]
MIIPPADPHAAYLAQREAIDAAIRRVLDSGWYILGREVESFEREFAAWLGAAHGIGVANGTDAVELALRSIGVGPGDEVIAPAHTATATIAAIEHAGAVPVLVDIEAETFGLDPEKVQATVRARAASRRLKAIVVVHLYGHPARIDELARIAREHDLRLIEDCAQAHGGRWMGQAVGTLGDVAAFSFYPTKNLGALGDGGAVVTGDSDVAARLRQLREYGWRERYRSDEPGINSRLDEMQAAILRAKLGRLSEDNGRRRAIAARYDATLRACGIVPPVVRVGAVHAYHQYAVLHPDRERWRAELRAHDVGSAVLYPLALHQQAAYAARLPVGVGGLATSERVCREVLCLPVHPQLEEHEIEAVARAVAATVATGR